MTNLASKTLIIVALAATLNVGVDARSNSNSFYSYDRTSKDFGQGQGLTPPSSRFHRQKVDYREEEHENQERAEQAKQQAAESENKARQEAAAAQKHSEEAAILANNKGVAAGRIRHFAEAIQYHEQAVQLAPANKQFRINLSAARTAYGQERLSLGDMNTASSMFRKALSAAPDNSLAAKLLADSMKRQGMDAGDASTRLALGDKLAAAADFEGATIEYQTAVQLEPSARTYHRMGDMALRFGQIETASNWYKQALVKDQNYGPAFRQLGLLAIAQNNTTGACSLLRKAVIADAQDVAAGQALVQLWQKQVSANPLFAENHLGLAGALQLTGDFAGAENEYRKLEALDPKNPGLAAGRASLARAIQHTRALKHQIAADTLIGQGLRREALAEISQAVMLEPRNAQFQFMLGETLESNGDYRGAHQAYLTCVLLDPEHNGQAAARIKEMQTRIAQVPAAQPAAAPQIKQAMNAANVNSTPVSLSSLSEPAMQKNMFEGSRTADTAPAKTVEATKSSTEAFVADPELNAALAQVSAAEAKKDYDSAISMMRSLVSNNLQNSSVHHRLAINLLASGQIEEAISEFRIASALSPSNSNYSLDLAQAMAIHKKSQQNSNSSANNREAAI